jgi:hypothetical protein
LPLISTSGGLPGEKKRSLIFAPLFNIAASNAGVEKGAGAGAAAAAAAPAGLGVAGAAGTPFGAVFVGEDIELLASWNEVDTVSSCPCGSCKPSKALSGYTREGALNRLLRYP